MKHRLRIMWLVLFCLNGAAWGVAQKKKRKASARRAPPVVVVAEKINRWREFTSTAGRFAITFPGTPTEETQAVGSEGAALEVHRYTLRSEGTVYAVAYVDYPIPVDNLMIAKQVLDNVAGAELEEAESSTSSTTEFTLGAHPGRFLKLTLPDGSILRNKMLMVGKRLYQVTLAMSVETKTPPAPAQFHDAITARFFDSFKLLPPANKPQ